MSLIPHTNVPRSMMDMDQWLKPFKHNQMEMWKNPQKWMHNMENQMKNQMNKQMTTLDMFDPFDALDHTIGRNFQWLNRPEFMMPMLPKVPQKYRITLDCAGYSPSSIKTECKDFILKVWGYEKINTQENDDFHMKEFRKTYKLPQNAECDKLVSFMTAEGQLVIEVPLLEKEGHMNMDLFPKIFDEKDGKVMKMQFTVPEKIHPENIHINIKDRCLIVKAEDKLQKPDGVTTFHYYKKTTLPENTDFDKLKCTYDNHQIGVWAPINMNWTPNKSIMVENKDVPMV